MNCSVFYWYHRKEEGEAVLKIGHGETVTVCCLNLTSSLGSVHPNDLVSPHMEYNYTNTRIDLFKIILLRWGFRLISMVAASTGSLPLMDMTLGLAYSLNGWILRILRWVDLSLRECCTKNPVSFVHLLKTTKWNGSCCIYVCDFPHELFEQPNYLL